MVKMLRIPLSEIKHKSQLYDPETHDRYRKMMSFEQQVKVFEGEFKKWYWPEKIRLQLHCFYNDFLQLHGEYKEWHRNGALSKHCFYKGGMLFGEYKEWYSDGGMREHSWRQWKHFVGEYKSWYLNGTKNEECRYNQKGQLVGEFKRWYDNKQVQRRCYFRYGKLHGPYRKWREDGCLLKKCFFVKGKLHGVRHESIPLNNALYEHGIIICKWIF